MPLNNKLDLIFLNELFIEEVNFFGSVLEQFNITKYNLFDLFFDSLLPLMITLPILSVNFLYYLAQLRLDNLVLYIKNFFIRFIGFIVSLYRPTMINTKNFFFGRFVLLFVKTFFKLYIRKRLMMFWRTNSQIIKLKTQLGIQEAIKSNFGNHYPFTVRLYEFYPFIVNVFVLIALTNLNGLLFYGFTNTAFLLQNFVYSFETVVGLTIMV